MKKYLAGIFAVVFSMAAFAMAAPAETSDQLLVTIPYDFVVGGKTLPAGTYRVSRVSTTDLGTLLLKNVDNHAGVLLNASEWEDVRADKPELQFQQIAGQHFLSAIETSEHVFNIPVSKSAVLLAMKSQQGSPASNAAGND
jgi:hypothetical protein